MDSIEIYRHYIGPYYNVGKVIKSPFPSDVRKADHHPSFSTKWFNGVVCWKDFAIDVAGISNGPIGFVQLMEGVSKEEARAIIKDSGFGTFKPRILTFEERLDMEPVPLVFEYGNLKPEHYQYYDMLFVSPSILLKYNIKSLEGILKRERCLWRPTQDNFGFYTKIGSGDKSYMPFNNYYAPKTPKVMHQNIDILEGYDQLPAWGEDLVLQKSLKDIMCVNACGYSATGASSENSFKVLEKYAYELSCRFKNIIAWGDDDKAGRNYALKIKQLIPKAKIATSIIAKDPSDMLMETRTQFYIHQVIDRAKSS